MKLRDAYVKTSEMELFKKKLTTENPLLFSGKASFKMFDRGTDL